jgi:tungstate transport system substrate-binding protein
MKTKTVTKWLGMALLLSILLSACSAAATPTAAPAPTQAPAKTEPTTAPAAPNGAKEMIMATTTSTQDSGLLDYLLPIFEKETGIKIKVVAVGSGQALQMGTDGNADVLLVHSPAKEKEFMDKKDGVRREDVMYNDFVIVGPEADPAKISGIKTGVDAFKAISDGKATFISRGDDSGTHTKEKSVWTAAKIEPKGDWYVSAGQGMGAVLTMSDEKQAYTLTDRATYLTMVKKGLKLKILVEGDKLLLNPYGVIAVNPAKSPKIQNDLANKFIDWIISVPTQEKIAAFKKEEFGISLFTPSSKPWKDAKGSQ